MRRLILVAALVAGPVQAFDEDGCPIWLCLPAGFSVPQCYPAHVEMIKRMMRFESPLPSFDSCQVEGSDDSGITLSIGVASRLFRYRNWSDDGWITPDEIIKDGPCTANNRAVGGAEIPCRTLQSIQTFQHGVQLGPTYYRDRDTGNDMMMDPETGEIWEVDIDLPDIEDEEDEEGSDT